MTFKPGEEVVGRRMSEKGLVVTRVNVVGRVVYDHTGVAWLLDESHFIRRLEDFTSVSRLAECQS